MRHEDHAIYQIINDGVLTGVVTLKMYIKIRKNRRDMQVNSYDERKVQNLIFCYGREYDGGVWEG